LGEDLGGAYESHGTKRRYYKDGSTFDAPATFDNPYARELRSLARGECYVRRGNRVSRERIVPLPPPFGLSKPALAKLMPGLLKVVQQRPEYYSPDNGDDKPSGGQSPSPPEPGPDTDDGPFAI
jgi:hypothetical protein